MAYPTCSANAIGVTTLYPRALKEFLRLLRFSLVALAFLWAFPSSGHYEKHSERRQGMNCAELLRS